MARTNKPTSAPDAVAAPPTFEIKDCALITQMGGVNSVLNLRELRERVQICPIECIFYHFCESLIRPGSDDVEFRNDLAIWASRHLRDRILAERLGILNPYTFANLEELRATVLEIIDERLSEVEMIPWVKRGDDFRFMKALTVVFTTGTTLSTPRDLMKALSMMTDTSIYYHFIEARRRRESKNDDFSAWLGELPQSPPNLIENLAEVDFYFLNIPELRHALIEAFRKALSNG